jgi:hypothetical protein
MLHTRLLLALSSFTWAAFLLLPGTLFAPGRQTYVIMGAIANENVWGILFMLHGGIALYTLLTETRNSVTLALDGFLGCILWTSSTTACFAAHWPNGATWLTSLYAYNPPAAMSGELWVAIASWWHLIRHWAEEEKEANDN